MPKLRDFYRKHAAELLWVAIGMGLGACVVGILWYEMN
jgi:hypothetical protein